MIPPVLTVAPTETPVSLPDALDHLRAPDFDDNGVIVALIEAATSHLDGWGGILGRCIMPQTWRQDLGCFPAGCLRLPFPDVSAVTVAYTDANGVTQTFAGANYHLTADAQSSLIALADGVSWPATDTRPDAVRVTMTAGFPALPSALKAAILLHVGHLYENREAVTLAELPSVLPLAYDALTAPYRRIGV